MSRYLCCVVLLCASAAQAENISTINLLTPPGGYAFPWGWTSPGTCMTYAQSLVSPGGYLTDIAISMGSHAEPNHARVYITGSRSDAGWEGYAGQGFAPALSDIRWSSDAFSIPKTDATVNQWFTPRLETSTGERLFLVIENWSLGWQGNSYGRAKIAPEDSDHYAGGEFLYLGLTEIPVGPTSLTDFDSAVWHHDDYRNTDLAFYANFDSTAVPEPATWLALISLLIPAAIMVRRSRGLSPSHLGLR